MSFIFIGILPKVLTFFFLQLGVHKKHTGLLHPVHISVLSHNTKHAESFSCSSDGAGWKEKKKQSDDMFLVCCICLQLCRFRDVEHQGERSCMFSLFPTYELCVKSRTQTAQPARAATSLRSLSPRIILILIIITRRIDALISRPHSLNVTIMSFLKQLPS